jgi:hypothetical protein
MNMERICNKGKGRLVIILKKAVYNRKDAKFAKKSEGNSISCKNLLGKIIFYLSHCFPSRSSRLCGSIAVVRLLFLAMAMSFLMGQTNCFAETVALSWDANSEPNLGGYKVYYKADSSSLPFDGAEALEGPSPLTVHDLTTATISGLDPARPYYFAVTAYDSIGNESPYSNIVTVPETAQPVVSSSTSTTNTTVSGINDATAPVVALTAPGNNSTVSGTVAITASASDNIGVSMVEFYRNGALLFASNVAPYTFNWGTTSVADGSYTLMAVAHDNAGNSKQSANVAVVVSNTMPDRTAPVINVFTLPAATTSLTVGVTTLSASDSIGVTGYLISESATAPAASASGWSTTAPVSFTFASAGSKTAYAWAKDAAGNVSISRFATTTITLPTTKIVYGKVKQRRGR